MSDLISRQSAIKAIEDLQDCYNGFSDTFDKACIIGVLEELPSVQTERKKGEWVRNFDGNEWYWFCSNCKEEWYEEDLLMGGNDFPNFCPNCGADMRGEENE